MKNNFIKNVRLQLLIFLAVIGLTCTQKSPLDAQKTIHEKSPMISEISATPTSVGIGGMSIVRVLLLDEDETPFKNRTVYFTTTLGSISESAQTDSVGWAQAIFKSSYSKGTAQITAKYQDDVASSISISVLETSDISLVMSTSKSVLYGNGVDTTLVSVELVGDSVESMVGTIINLSANIGKITNNGQLIIQSYNKGSLYFISDVRKSDELAVITATYKNYSNIDTIKVLGLDFELYPTPTEILADGKSTSTIQAILKESKTKVAIANAKIVFSADIGLIPQYTLTNLSGLAKVDLVSSTQEGLSTVTAKFGEMSVDTSVTFMASEPTNLSVTVSPPVIPADGSTISTITAIITDFGFNPVHSGIPVRFTKVSGPDISFTNTVVTNVDGTASTQLTALGLGTAVIALDVAGLRDTVSIECIAGPVDQIVLKTDKEFMKADGIENATITATVMDANGYPLAGKTVSFTSDFGDITKTVRTDQNGNAVAKFSSSTVGTSTIYASVLGSTVTASLIIQLLADIPFTINLEFDPKEIGVRNTGQNQTTNIYATVRDNKNNIVDDGTLVRFAIVSAPEGVTLSTNEPIPTVSGIARISCSSGIRSGSARISAEVLDEEGASIGVKAVSSELIVHAGPPYIEDITRPRETTHLKIVARRMNIYAGLDTTLLTVSVGDKYNNPVAPGTAVYLTTSGGFVTTRSYTDKNGLVNDTIFGGNPFPSVDRFYNYVGMQDPNTGEIITDYQIPDFEDAEYIFGLDPDLLHVDNSYDNGPGDYIENNGVARVMAYAVGMNANGNEAKAWDDVPVVISKDIAYWGDNSRLSFAAAGNTVHYLSPGVGFTFYVFDSHGNPIAAGSTINFSLTAEGVAAKVSPATITTEANMGVDYYHVVIENTIDPKNPKPGWTSVSIRVNSRNGIKTWTTSPIYISADTE